MTKEDIMYRIPSGFEVFMACGAMFAGFVAVFAFARVRSRVHGIWMLAIYIIGCYMAHFFQGAPTTLWWIGAHLCWIPNFWLIYRLVLMYMSYRECGPPPKTI